MEGGKVSAGLGLACWRAQGTGGYVNFSKVLVISCRTWTRRVTLPGWDEPRLRAAGISLFALKMSAAHCQIGTRPTHQSPTHRPPPYIPPLPSPPPSFSRSISSFSSTLSSACRSFNFSLSCTLSLACHTLLERLILSVRHRAIGETFLTAIHEASPSSPPSSLQAPPSDCFA